MQGAEPIAARIVEAAEGNPLFIEELVAMLVDEGLLLREHGRWAGTADLVQLRMPTTIAALLGGAAGPARGWRAGGGRAGQRGRQGVLPGGGGRAGPGRATAPGGRALLALARKELIRPDGSGFGGEDAFRFRHQLLRDAAYEALSKRDRADLHERFAAWLTRTSGERHAEFEEIIGYHLEQAGPLPTELGARRGGDRAGPAGR